MYIKIEVLWPVRIRGISGILHESIRPPDWVRISPYGSHLFFSATLCFFRDNVPLSLHAPHNNTMRRLLLLLSLFLTGTGAQTISVNRDCVPAGEEFAVTFVNVDPQVDDWIGIVPTSESTAAFSTLGTWVWGCGTMDCTSAAASGRVRIVAAGIGNGTFVAVLSRGNVGPPWSAYAVSNSFAVAGSCDSTVLVQEATVEPPSNQLAREHLDTAWGEIQSVIDEDFRMAPQFLRMAFHDCVGGCDGTLDGYCIPFVSFVAWIDIFYLNYSYLNKNII
jgi:hypothetical protein